MSLLTQENYFDELNIGTLLDREEVVLDNQLISKEIAHRSVLVTGAGGTIGSELCRQIAVYNPDKLILVDIYENTMYQLENELEERFPRLSVVSLVASVRDNERLQIIFNTYRPDIVFHAAAHKHVPLMETSPGEAVKNNVLGTLNTAKYAAESGAKKFILISTDKAVNPTNVMGASKRICEMIISALQNSTNTEFAAVRFGNVLGSSGSVALRFQRQIKQGGPVTVTHPEVTRYFMTVSEAAQLVLQAAAYAKGGEMFVLDMGKPVKILDLAKRMISLAGLEPERDIKIEFTGHRPGDKEFEELLTADEGLTATEHKKIFVAKAEFVDINELMQKIEKLKSVVDKDSEIIKSVIADVVPTYCIGI